MIGDEQASCLVHCTHLVMCPRTVLNDSYNSFQFTFNLESLNNNINKLVCSIIRRIAIASELHRQAK